MHSPTARTRWHACCIRDYSKLVVLLLTQTQEDDVVQFGHSTLFAMRSLAKVDATLEAADLQQLKHRTGKLHLPPQKANHSVPDHRSSVNMLEGHHISVTLPKTNMEVDGTTCL